MEDLIKLGEALVSSSQKNMREYQHLVEVSARCLEIIEENPSLEESNILQSFFQERNQLFESLQNRSQITMKLFQDLCQALGVEQISLLPVEGKIPKAIYTEIKDISSANERLLMEALELNRRIEKILSRELEGIKLDLHRLRAGRNVRSAYAGMGTLDSQFIDKNR